jgi:hypothetical protein
MELETHRPCPSGILPRPLCFHATPRCFVETLALFTGGLVGCSRIGYTKYRR